MFKKVEVSPEEQEKQEDELYKGKSYDILEKVLTFGMKHRKTTIISAVVLLALSAFC